MSEYPQNSLIITPFRHKQWYPGENEPYHDFLNISTIVNVPPEEAESHSQIYDTQIDTKYYHYYQQFGSLLGQPTTNWGIGLGFEMHDVFLEDTQNPTNELPEQSSFGMLIESITLVDDQEEVLPYTYQTLGNAVIWNQCCFKVRRYDVVVKLPRPEHVIGIYGGEYFTWADFIPQTGYFTDITSSICMTNQWLYEKLDSGADMSNLFNYDYIENEIRADNPNNFLNRDFEAMNIPVDITAMGMQHGFIDGTHTVTPGGLFHNRFPFAQDWSGPQSIFSTWTAHPHLTVSSGNTYPESFVKNVLPIAFIQRKSYTPGDYFGYSYPNQSMTYYRRDCCTGLDTGDEMYGSRAFGGAFDDVYGENIITGNYGEIRFLNTQTDYYNTYRTDARIGSYEPKGITWYLSQWQTTGGSATPSSMSMSTRDSETDLDKLIENEDVISYSIGKTPIKNIIGRCRVKYGHNVAKDTYDFKTEWFYWKDLPTVQLYADEEGVTYGDYSLQNFYSLDPTEAIDEDNEITTYDKCELTYEAKYINDINSARHLAQYLLGWNMNTHTTISAKLHMKYCDLEIGDIVAYRELLGEDGYLENDYSMKSFKEKFDEDTEVQEYDVKLGQTLYPYFMVTKVEIKDGFVNINTIQLHDWAGVVPYKSNLSLAETDFYDYLDTPLEEEIVGCMDATAENYDSTATIACDDCCEYTEQLDYIPGDINSDGSLDVLDVVAMVNFILNNDVPSEMETFLGDINSDGQMDVLDVVAIVTEILN